MSPSSSSEFRVELNEVDGRLLFVYGDLCFGVSNDIKHRDLIGLLKDLRDQATGEGRGTIH